MNEYWFNDNKNQLPQKSANDFVHGVFLKTPVTPNRNTAKYKIILSMCSDNFFCVWQKLWKHL